MTIPDFNSYGLLPSGIHKATLDEIRERFCSFGDIQTRNNLFKSLLKYINTLKKHNVKFYLCIDGSYVTQKESPGDLDVLVLYDFEYNNKDWSELVSDKSASFRFKGLQILSAFIDSFGEENLLDFAQDVKDNMNLRKGIIRVVLW